MSLLWIITGLSFVISYAFKLIGDTYFEQRISIIGNSVGLQLAHNDGVAFSLRLGDMLQLPLILLALVFVVYLALHSERTRMNHIGFGLILGGALGNVVDRIPDGLVTDFVRVGSFPVFNVADACITIGVILLLLEMLLQRGRTQGY
jgi:signal peptidase II